jgi:hypothetical protein
MYFKFSRIRNKNYKDIRLKCQTVYLGYGIYTINNSISKLFYNKKIDHFRKFYKNISVFNKIKKFKFFLKF